MSSRSRAAHGRAADGGGRWRRLVRYMLRFVTGAVGRRKRVFLASTASDLRAHRKAVAEALERMDHSAVRMEIFGALPNAPVAECLARAASADALVVMVAHRYGWVPPLSAGGDDYRSISWLEVEAARAVGVPIFVFTVDEGYGWPHGTEQDGLARAEVLSDAQQVQRLLAALQALHDFKRWLRTDLAVVCDSFTTPDHLATRVATSLAHAWLGDAAGSAHVASPSPAPPRLLQPSPRPSAGPRARTWHWVAAVSTLLALLALAWRLVGQRLRITDGSISAIRAVPAAAPPGAVWSERGQVLLVPIPGGTFMQGSPVQDLDSDPEERPQHVVTLRPFWLGAYEVTREEYGRFLDAQSRGSELSMRDRRPVVGLSWDEASEFAAWAGARLPTEAEWEYAARAGTSDARYGPVEAIAWYHENSHGHAHEVGQMRSNAFGLYDMLGNLWEWCADAYGPYAQDGRVMAGASNLGMERVVRGGSWSDDPRALRAATRYRQPPDARGNILGFRIARSSTRSGR